MATTEPRTKTWTREEYHRTATAGLFVGDRVELIRGEILMMSPMKPQHAVAVQLVAAALHNAVSSSYSVRVQLPIAIEEDSEPEPDVAVVLGQPRDFISSHPNTAALVIEISDSTLSFDRDQKRQLYADANVSEYWVLNLIDRRLEIYSDLMDGKYACEEFKSGNDQVEVSLPQSSWISVASLLP